MYKTGELPVAGYGYCGGRADVRGGFHHLCKARSDQQSTPDPTTTP